VLLAGSVLLLGSGAWSLVRLTSRWWRLLTVPALVVVFAVSLSVVGPAVAATNVPPTRLGATPADVGLAATDVEVVTADGVVRSAWWIPGDEATAVVLLHGAGSTRSSVLDQAAVLVGEGHGVLALDARGHGTSGGRAMDFGWYGDLDVMAAVDHLVARPEVDQDRIAVVGMSMGGEEAVGAAAADPRIAAVVAEGATSRTAQDKSWLSERYGWRGAAQEGIEWLTYELTDLLTAADQPITLRDAVAAAAPTPVLLIAGGATTDEEHAARHIRSGSPGTVELWVAPGSAHTAALDDHPDEWRTG
jgi:pimeloyl-ACP methyl ester carboxylesterase